MKRFATLIITCLLLSIGSVTGCSQSKNKEVTFDQLFSNLNAYSNKDITIEGFYFQGFEIIVLSEGLEFSGFAEGHLVPKGRMMWVSGGIPKEVYDKLNQQQVMGPLERFGKVRITGKFEYGGKYGHLGGYDQQITPTETIILPWSPQASETQEQEGFAIYLTKEDIPPVQMPTLSHVDIADQPIISTKDTITYNAQTHELKLTPSAFEHISSLEVPVRGKSFIVCVDKKIIYWGAFWTPISSISFDGVTIWKPYSSQVPAVITLELGYPSSSFYGGGDPRNSPEILKSLEQADKLISKLSITAINQLPRSMKGYELYSWLEDGQWQFTLITGTDRNKTLEEITSKVDFISEVGWVKVNAAGVEAIETALSKLPRDEFILWLAGMREPSGQTDINIQLPPKQTSDAIKEFTGQRGLDFQIQTP